MEQWKGKVCVVTGASSGIGAATALALANAGMQVVAVARRLQPMQELSKRVTGAGRVLARRCDVSVEADVQQLFQYIVSSLGGVDIVINNAALLQYGTITNCSEEIPQISLQDMDAIFSVNVRGMLSCSQHAVRSMRERSVKGHVIFINSVAGHYIPQAGELLPLNVYPASKHAITAIAEVMRREFSHCNLPIRVSCVSPGAVDTDMIRTAELPEGVPILKPEDVVAAILYCISAPPRVNVQDVIIHATGEKY